MNDIPNSPHARLAVGDTTAGDVARAATAATVDGVICFGGEDWWYHNRGHYDMQMMRSLAAALPVVYVNSLGMRVPRPTEGRMFLTRVGRKLRSIRRGLVHFDDGISVLSPAALPGRRGAALTRSLVHRAVRAAARTRGITRPLVWIACPTAADAAFALNAFMTVYQRTDRYECFEGVDAQRIRALDLRLKKECDVTVFCSHELFKREAGECRRAARVDHGVDVERFVSAAEGRTREPSDLERLPRPRVGFVGGVDAHTFDPELFVAVAGRLPHVHFMIVGASSLPVSALDAPNVTHLGQRSLDDVPAYMAGCDVLIMPWCRSPWIEACNPVKLKEYLATGRPIVTTDFPELRHYDGLVRIAQGVDAFAAEILSALEDPGDPHASRERVRGMTWSHQARRVLDLLTVEEIATNASRPMPTTRPQLRLVRPPAHGGTAADDAGLASRTIELASCVLLAGGLRPSAVVAESGRSVLDLPLTGDRTIGSEWVERLGEIASEIDGPLRIRVVHDSRMPPPWPMAARVGQVIVEREPRPLRGPAGVACDACRDARPETHVLLAEAARYIAVSLVPFVRDHAGRDADMTVAANPDGTPAGIYLLRRSVLDLVAPTGYVDLKEQLIPNAVDAGLDVRVHHLAAPGALPVRTSHSLHRAAELSAEGKADSIRPAMQRCPPIPRARGRP